MNAIGEIMRLAPVIPVLIIDDAADAKGLAEALVAGGLPVLEVTLRTPAALDAIREMKKVPGAVVGAGTVLDPTMLDAAVGAGSEFIVSPGLTEPLGCAAVANDVPFLPGTANAGDVMRGRDLGLSHFKFFPATAAGGVPALKSLCAVFTDMAFCPTGGITEATAADWLAIEQVLCVGGSWIVPRGTADLAAVEETARRAAAIA